MSKQLGRRLERGAWDEAEVLLAQASDQTPEHMFYGRASSGEAVALSAAWVSQRPESAFANLVLGATLVVSGWKTRGDGYAKDVDDAAWAPFLGRLSSAEEPLHRAANLDRARAEPYAWLIHAGLGLETSLEDLRGQTRGCCRTHCAKGRDRTHTLDLDCRGGVRERLNPAFVYDRACRELGLAIQG